MAPTVHSPFSASSAARHLGCLGSYALAQAQGPQARRSTIYSAEGTLAHAMSEACIHAGTDPMSWVGRSFMVDGHTFKLDEAFALAAASYVGFVRGLRAMGYIVALETRVSPAIQWPDKAPLAVELFGTADCIAYHPASRHLVIGDLKFGAGVSVEVQDNPQLLYYAAGAAHAAVLGPLCAAAGATFAGVDDVGLVVIQPRAVHRHGPIRAARYKHADVVAWARDTLYPGAVASLAEPADGQNLAPGKWCRFCPVLPGCPGPKRAAFAAASAAFQGAAVENIATHTPPGAPFGPTALSATPIGQLSDEELAAILDKIDVVEPWLRAVRELAHERLTAGRAVQGWTVTPKRALRRWRASTPAEEQAVLDRLTSLGLKPDDIVDTRLRSPAEVERRMTRMDYQQHVSPLVDRSSSGTTLAPTGDPRARVGSARAAAAAFASQTGQDPLSLLNL